MPKTDRSRPIPEEALDRLTAWSLRKPRIALMGEFSSGKSTLLNLLIGEDLLPTRVTATELPPVWFGHGDPASWWVDRQGRRHPLGFGDFAGVPRSARYIRVLAPAPFLERCDVIDTPGISDPNLEEESWRFPVGQASFVLWCTPSTQAWRETERSTWLSLPERLRAQSLLVVTRADKLGLPDREKVARRLSREAAGLFDGLVFLASLDALRGRERLEATGDAALWEASGGAELAARIDLGLAAVRSRRARLLRRYRDPKPPAPREPVAEPAIPGFAEPEPLRLVTPEPVRPRRVELPGTRRTERPLGEAAPDPLPGALPDPLPGALPDPLEEIRAGWKALRSSEPAEPAPVLRLTDPLPRAEPPRAPEAPALADRDVPRSEGAAPALAEEPPAEAEETAAQAALPRAVRLWREIVARTPEIPPNSPILAMIDQLLCELSRDHEPSDGTGAAQATIIGRNQAA